MFWVLDSFCSSSLSRTRPEGWNTIKTLKYSFSYIKKQTERMHHWCIIRLKSGIGLFRCSVLNIQDFDLIIFYSVFFTLTLDRIIRYNNDLMTVWEVWGVRWPSDLLRCYFLFCSHHHISSHHGPASQRTNTIKLRHVHYVALLYSYIICYHEIDRISISPRPQLIVVPRTRI